MVPPITISGVKNDSSPPRMVLGPDPLDGSVVLLTEDSAYSFISRLSEARSVRTVEDYWEVVDPGMIDELEPEELDEETDLDPLDSESGRMDARLWMVDELDDTINELLDGLVTYHDSMGGYPWAEIDSNDVEEIRRRLSDAGYEVVGWPQTE